MTSRQRVEAAFHHKEPDRTPIFEYVLQPPVADAVLERYYVYGNRLVEYTAQNGWEAGVRQTARDMAELAKKLHHDMVYAVPNDSPPSSVQPSPEKNELIPGDPVEEIARRVEAAEASPFFVSDENMLIYRFLREEMSNLGLDLPVLAPAYAHGTWTDTALMQTMLLEPELVHRFYSAKTTDTIALIKKYHALGIEMVGIGGDFAGTRGPIISPEAYRRFIMPEVRKLSDYIHSLGMFSVNASDGNLWPVINDFLLGCGVDGYLEIDFFAGMDLGKLKKRFGDKITFIGNLDCGNILSFGTVEDVKNHTRDCLEKGWGSGGHIICASNAITESVPVKNYFAIYESYNEFFGLRGV